METFCLVFASTDVKTSNLVIFFTYHCADQVRVVLLWVLKEWVRGIWKDIRQKVVMCIRTCVYVIIKFYIYIKNNYTHTTVYGVKRTALDFNFFMYCLNRKLKFVFVFWYLVPSTVLLKLGELIFVLLDPLPPSGLNAHIDWVLQEEEKRVEDQCALHRLGKSVGLNFRLCFWVMLFFWQMFALFTTVHSLAACKCKEVWLSWCMLPCLGKK